MHWHIVLTLAHGLGQTYDLPVPFWLYFFAAAVPISFVQVGMFVGEGHETD